MRTSYSALEGRTFFHREEEFGPRIKYRIWKSIYASFTSTLPNWVRLKGAYDAMSDFSETDGEGCLMLSRCWGFSSGGLSLNNNWNDNNNGLCACRKFFSLIPLGDLDRLRGYGLQSFSPLKTVPDIPPRIFYQTSQNL